MPVQEKSEIWNDPEHMPSNPATLLDAISVEAANVLAAAAEHKASCAPYILHDEAMSEILFHAEEVESRFAAWQTQIPQEWWPTPLSRDLVAQDIIDAGLLGDYCDMYPDISVCAMWNSFRTTRLRILSLIADYDWTDLKREKVLQIQVIADDILASVPFTLGSKSEPAGIYDTDFVYPSLPGQSVSMSHYQTAAAFGGVAVFVPLRVIFSFTRYLRGDQLQFAMEQLGRLGILYDVRKPTKGQ